MSDSLPALYAQMAAFTEPICRSGIDWCGRYHANPHRCCEAKYCEIARGFAKEKYGIDLQDTGHPALPFMGDSGCTVAPYLRPQCSLHACPINYGPGLDGETMQEYSRLRNEILLEAKRQSKMPEFR